MISFIIIGRNEARNIERCIVSVLETINVNKLTDAEILYIDSNSIDGTVSIVQKHPQVVIYRITQGWNAAVGRNVGAEVSEGEVLFFIDGDVVIDPFFLSFALQSGHLNDGILTGALYEYQYNAAHQLVNQGWRNQPDAKEKRIYFTGGIFLIKRRIWDVIGGMDSRMKKGQDGDLAMRLYASGYKIHMLNKKMGDHHTIKYIHSDRVWATLFKGNMLYAKSVLYRRHFFKWPALKRLMTHDYTSLALLLTVAALIVRPTYIVTIPYVFIVIFKSVKQRGISWQNKLSLIPYYCVRDITVIVGFFFFYPRATICKWMKICL